MKIILKIQTVFLVIISIFCGQIASQNLEQIIPFDTSVTTGYLSNGLRYYIKPNSKPENKVELRLALNAGSILEDDDQQGLAHFMEHMNFNGTEHYPKNALVDFLQTIGVEFGADLNAYTGFDETVFILPIPTENRDNIAKGFEVLSDWAQKALITDQDVNDERKVVLEESRLGKGAQDRMMQKYLPKMLAGSRYASRLPIGKDEILKTFPPDAIRRFYKDWYRPNLMAVAVVGDITVAEAKLLIEKYFSSLTNPPNERPRTLFEVAPFKKKEAMALTDKESTNQSFSLVYSSRKSTADKTVGDYRNSIIRNLFIEILNQRFQELSQSANPPFLYSYGYIDGWARGYESFQLVSVPSGDLNAAINASIGELVRAQKFGFNKSELDIAKNNTLSYVEKLYNERNTTESGRIISEYLRNFLQNEPMPGIAIDYAYYQSLLPTITIDDVNKVANDWLNDNKKYFALYEGPENGAAKISNKKLLKIVAKAFKQKVSPLEEKIRQTTLLSSKPVPGKVISSIYDSALNTNTYFLSNGLKVTTKQTDFKSDEILFHGIKQGGVGKYPASDKLLTQNLDAIISSMGYGNFTPTDLQNFLAGKLVSNDISTGEVRSSLSGNSSKKDLETLLELNYLQLTSPRLDEELFKGYIAKQIAALKFIKANPQTAFFDTMSKVMNHGDPYARIFIPSVSQLQKLTAESALNMYKNEYQYADGFHFFLVGNIDESTIIPLMEKYIASLPVSGILPVVKETGLRPIQGNHTLTVNFGKEPKSLILDQYYNEIPYSEDLALKATLMAEILNIKIIEEMREKIGGIYSGGMYANVLKLPYERYGITLYLPCGPESVDTLLATAKLEMMNLIQNGPEQKDLDKVKIAKLEAHKNEMQNNGPWISMLESTAFEKMDVNRILKFEEYLNQITAEDIKNTAALLLFNGNHFRAVLNPEK
jgi:zinc protease